ncbi:hypothetical protein PYCCODRAFT_1429508 [Trametes coccinea BRFM310]|uniref:Mif2/CENP-C cupin domain-containing protein n=1 Tax=Trametes coccinea (strain BRFM310) TaxID=1353009 RepID=A0A1Y2J870_TRAC3|nr:hypothetical protein PYCCODRAFT_1429508 [Trametes coccinea BRFM310]
MSSLRRSPPLASASSSYSSSSSHISHSNDVIFMNDVARIDIRQGSSSSSSEQQYSNALSSSDWLDEEDDLSLGGRTDEAAAAEQSHVSITQHEETSPVEHGHTHVDTPEPEEQQVVVHNPEESWDDNTPSKCEVLVDGQKVMRRVVCTAKKIEARSALPGGSYSRLFMERGCLQVVHRVLRPNRKMRVDTVPNYVFVFYVIQGAVSFTMLESSFVVCSGGSFLIPPGNESVIRNAGDRDAKLFFVEAVEH